MKKILNWIKRIGNMHRTLIKVNNGELRITKKGNVKEPKK